MYSRVPSAVGSPVNPRKKSRPPLAGAKALALRDNSIPASSGRALIDYRRPKIRESALLCRVSFLPTLDFVGFECRESRKYREVYTRAFFSLLPPRVSSRGCGTYWGFNGDGQKKIARIDRRSLTASPLNTLRSVTLWSYTQVRIEHQTEVSFRFDRLSAYPQTTGIFKNYSFVKKKS